MLTFQAYLVQHLTMHLLKRLSKTIVLEVSDETVREEEIVKRENHGKWMVRGRNR